MVRSSLQQKNVKAKFIACELLVKRVVTSGTLLQRNQFYFAESHNGIRERSGSELDSRLKGHGFEPHSQPCVLEQDTLILA